MNIWHCGGISVTYGAKHIERLYYRSGLIKC